MIHPALQPGRTAVITGAASGIGLATAQRLAEAGMDLCLIDSDDAALTSARDGIAEGARGHVIAISADVANPDAMASAANAVAERLKPLGMVMNNAIERHTGTCLDEPENWRRTIDVGLFGVVHGCQAFAPALAATGQPGLIVNVGSKQGITNPPGRPHYNVAKAAVKAYTELLEHDLRNRAGSRVTAHLLVPGMTTTAGREHKPGAWWPDQVVDFMLDALARGDFYIICPDGEVTPEMDRKRVLWAAGDLTENRPALSRWHPEFKAAFEAFEP